MIRSGPKPNNMKERCRLCLTDDGVSLPIFGDDDNTNPSDIPLSFRIMACVSVEVSVSDDLPTLICQSCLNHVNTWHEFKQLCDTSQEVLKEWLNNPKHGMPAGEKEIVIKQEKVDEDEQQDLDEEVLDVTTGPGVHDFTVDYIKQEEIDVETDEGDLPVVADVCDDPLGLLVDCISGMSPSGDEDVELLPEHQVEPMRLRISNIKTESDAEGEEGNASAGQSSAAAPGTPPAEGQLLRSILQHKTKLTMYSRQVPTILDARFSEYRVKPFTCNICEKSFAYNYLLKRHEKTHTGARNVCVFCRKGFSSHANLMQHLENYDGTVSKPYSCDTCQRVFSCRTQFLSHRDKIIDGVCPDIPPEEEEEGYLEVGDGDPEGKFDCYLCNLSFPSQFVLKAHMRKEHLHYTCHKCSKAYTNGVALSNHLRSHSLRNDRHTCTVCDLTFTNVELLNQHKQTHGETMPMAIIPSDGEASDGEEGSSLVANPAFQDLPATLDETKEVKMEPVDNEFKCYLCSDSFATASGARLHLKRQHEQFPCHRCPKIFNTAVSLSNHLRGHSITAFKKHRCNLCLKTFPRYEMFLKHRKSHAGLERRALRNSEEASTSARPVQGHTCNQCKFVASTAAALSQHLAAHARQKMFSCSVCHTRMGNAAAIQKHMLLAHGKQAELQPVHINTLEPEVVLETDETTDQEKANETGKEDIFGKHWRCAVCNKMFPSRYLHATHMKMAHPHLVPKCMFKCKICNCSFQYKSILLRHSKVHHHVGKSQLSEDVPVSCQVCYRTFPDAKTLNNHKGVHTRFKYYSCDTCHKSFNGANAWQRHLRMHQKGIVYSCKMCGKKFMSKADLHEHKKMHIKMKIYSCAICKNSYHSSSALGKHKRRHGHWFSQSELSDGSELADESDGVLVIDESAELSEGEEPTELVLSELPPKPEVVITDPLGSDAFLTPPPQLNIPRFPSGRKRPYCDICLKAFGSVGSMKKHRRTEHKSVKKEAGAGSPSLPAASSLMGGHACPICGRLFNEQAALIRHKGWHTRRPNYISPGAAPKAPPPEPQLAADDIYSDSNPSNEPTTDIDAENSASGTGTVETVRLNPCFVKLEPSDVREFECHTCNKTFTSNSALENHAKIHLSVRTRQNGNMNITNSEGAQRRLACKICRRPFHSKKALITHIGWHSRSSHVNKKFPLPRKQKFRTKRNWATQQSQVDESQIDESQVDELQVDESHVDESHVDESHVDESQVDESQVDESHVDESHVDESHVDESQVDESQVDESQVEESGAQADAFTCSVCNKMFSSAEILAKHRKLHTRKLLSSIKLKPGFGINGEINGEVFAGAEGRGNVNRKNSLTCHVCLRVFKLRKYLEVHMRVHTGERRFHCNMCPQTYTRSGSLWKHKRTHHWFKAFSCPICHKRFGLKIQLTNHMAAHNMSEDYLIKPQNLFPCSQCDKTYTRKDNLRYHERLHHNQ